jgi:hypothetical protein
MKLRAAGFSPKGQGDLRGTIIAYSDAGEPLGAEHTGNYSKDGAKELLQKLSTIGVDLEVARAQLTRLLGQLRSSVDEAFEDGPPVPNHDLPVVVTSERPLREFLDDSWALLEEANAPSPRYFRQGDVLVELAVTEGEPVVPKVLGVPRLRITLDRLADYVRVDDKAQEHRARPPKDMLESMLAQVQPSMPPLNGIMAAPFIEPGGAIVSAPGYHQGTGLYLSLVSGLLVPSVPERPGPQDIAEAKRLLLEEALGDFPFVNEADRCNAVVTILDPEVRPLIKGPTPLHLIEAPMEGTGKGLFAQVVGYIAMGRPPEIWTEGGDDDEWRKRITSALLRLPQMLLLDNIRRRLESASLSAALTAEVWVDRMLGHSRDVSMPVRTTWLATGNNPSYSGEIGRRLVRVRLDASLEHPWERTGFRHPELATWVRENRGRLLWATLTLIRAWVVAGRPKGTEVMGSFEDWAATLGGIMQVAGIPGFLQNRQEVYARVAAEGEAWRALVAFWWEAYHEQRVGVDQLLQLATENRLLTDRRAGRTEGGSRTAMGMELAKQRDRVFGAFRIRGAGVSSDTGGAMYSLQKLDGGQEKVTEVTAPPVSSTTETTEPTEPFSVIDAQSSFSEVGSSKEVSAQQTSGRCQPCDCTPTLPGGRCDRCDGSQCLRCGGCVPPPF